MKYCTEEEWIKLQQNIDYNNLYKKYRKLESQLERRANTILKTQTK